MASGLRLVGSMGPRHDDGIEIRPKSFLILVAVGCFAACSRQPPVASSALISAAAPASPVAASADQSGATPTQTLPLAVIPKGTAIMVRLRSGLSSTASHSGDSFDATLDQPIVIQGEVLAAEGAAVSGRIVSAASANTVRHAGYLRLTLTSIEIAGKDLSLHTSAVFAKGLYKRPDGSAADNATLPQPLAVGEKNHEVKFSTGKQLKFWLVEPLPVKG